MTETEAKTPRPIIVGTIHWFAITVQPEADARVAADLGKQGFDVFLAVSHERHHTANRAWVELSEYPLRPYIFVGIDDGVNALRKAAGQHELSLKHVADTLGVASVVSLTPDGSPSKIPAEIIRRMRADINIKIDEASRRVRRKESPFTVGQEIEIRPEAPFGGYTCKVDEILNGGIRVRLPNGLPVRLEDHEVIPIAWSKKRVA